MSRPCRTASVRRSRTGQQRRRTTGGRSLRRRSLEERQNRAGERRRPAAPPARCRHHRPRTRMSPRATPRTQRAKQRRRPQPGPRGAHAREGSQRTRLDWNNLGKFGPDVDDPRAAPLPADRATLRRPGRVSSRPAICARRSRSTPSRASSSSATRALASRPSARPSASRRGPPCRTVPRKGANWRIFTVRPHPPPSPGFGRLGRFKRGRQPATVLGGSAPNPRAGGASSGRGVFSRAASRAQRWWRAITSGDLVPQRVDTVLPNPRARWLGSAGSSTG